MGDLLNALEATLRTLDVLVAREAEVEFGQSMAGWNAELLKSERRVCWLVVG